jgi:hypothetical protein
LSLYLNGGDITAAGYRKCKLREEQPAKIVPLAVTSPPQKSTAVDEATLVRRTRAAFADWP